MHYENCIEISRNSPLFFYLLLAQAEEEAVQEKGILRKNIQVQRPGLYIIYNV